MATRHTIKRWISKVRDIAVFAMIVTLGFNSMATAGLTVSKADVEVAKKAQAQTAQRVDELEKQLDDLEMQAQKSAARAKAAKAELDEVEKSLSTSKVDIDKRSKEQPAFEKAAADAATYLDKLKKEVDELKAKQGALEEKIEENSSSISVPSLLIVPCADEDDDAAKAKAEKEAAEAKAKAEKKAAEAKAKAEKKAAEAKAKAEKEAAEAKAEAEEEAAEAKAKAEKEAAKAKAKDLAEPGFWRQRALKKGADPKTTGEKTWLAAWKKSQGDDAAAEEAAAKAEKEAAEAKAKAEKEAEAAKVKAEAENAAAEAKAKAEAEAAEAKAEAEAKAAETQNKDLAEPGFWRQRALKKGEEPTTTGEKNWLAGWKKEQADKAAAEAAAANSATEAERKEAEAKAAAEQAEKEAAAAKERAESEATAKAEADAKAAAEKEKDMAEPGFWRQRALKKGEEPTTTGERKWVAAWKLEQDEARKTEEARVAAERAAEEAKIANEKEREEAKAKREQEEAAAKANREKAEAAAKAKEDAERAAREGEELKAKLNAAPGFWRQRALQRGEKAETPGEEKWLAAWQAEQKSLAESEAESARKEQEAEAARKLAEEQAAKAEALADAEAERERLEREKQDRLAKENEEPGYFRQRALKDGAKPETAGERKWFAQWQDSQKSRIEIEMKDKAEKERIVRMARTELAKVNEALMNKTKELEVAESGAESKQEAKNANAEELARSKKLYERATAKIAESRLSYQNEKNIADGFAEQLASTKAELKTLKAELANRQEKINNLLDRARKGQDLYIAAEAARNRYLTARNRTEGLQSKLEEFTRLASENKNRIPDVKAAVEEATSVVIDAREAYEAYRKKLYNDTKGADKIETEIIIIEADKKNKTSQERELEPLAVEVAKAVKELRGAEKVAVQVYHDADFYSFSVRKTERAIARNKTNLVRYKNEYEKAVEDLKPFGSLDPLPPKVDEAK